MKLTLVCKFVAVFTCTFCLCKMSRAQEPSPSVAPSVHAQALLDRRPVPAGLPEIGERADNTIRVVVYGPIDHPGIYHFPRGALVHDALKAAQRFPETFYWEGSYILRHPGTQQSEVIPFYSKTKKTWPQVPLQEGDLLYLSYEVY